MEKYSYYVMIDPETRKKIVEQKNKGYTNNKIKKNTGVSLPTIRKILKESPSSQPTIKGTHIRDDEEILIINLTRVWPSRGISTQQRLRNGVPSWRLSHILRELYPEHIVGQIINQVNENGGAGKIYQANITKNHTARVTPLTFKVLPIDQIAQ